MPLDNALDTALRGASVTVANLVEIVLPGRTIRVVDGAAQLLFNGNTFTGEDAVYGTLGGIDPVTEQVGTEAPATRFTFLPSDVSALAALTNPANQGSPVNMWFCAINPETGLIIGAPELLFVGEIDTADVEISGEATLITFDVSSAWDRLFEAGEGYRWNDKFWQTIYPGELGFQYVTEIQRDLPWGYDAPRPQVVTDTVGGSTGPGSSPGGYGGGGGGGGAGGMGDVV